MILIICRKGIVVYQTHCVRINAVEIPKLRYVFTCWLDTMGYNRTDLWSNRILVWVCNIWHGPLLLHSSLKLCFVLGSNALDQMLFYCIVVFQYVSITFKCGARSNGLSMHWIEYRTIYTFLAFIHSGEFRMKSAIYLLCLNMNWVMSEWPNCLMLWLPETIDRGLDLACSCTCHCFGLW